MVWHVYWWVECDVRRLYEAILRTVLGCSEETQIRNTIMSRSYKHRKDGSTSEHFMKVAYLAKFLDPPIGPCSKGLKRNENSYFNNIKILFNSCILLNHWKFWARCTISCKHDYENTRVDWTLSDQRLSVAPTQSLLHKLNSMWQYWTVGRFYHYRLESSCHFVTLLICILYSKYNFLLEELWIICSHRP